MGSEHFDGILMHALISYFNFHENFYALCTRQPLKEHEENCIAIDTKLQSMRVTIRRNYELNKNY